MSERLSLHGLGARLAPDLYLKRYLENVAEACDALLLPGEGQARSLESFYLTLRFREMAPDARGTAVAESRTLDIWDTLFRSPRLAIVGECGAGKTSTLKYATTTLARNKMPEAYIRRLTFLHLGQAFGTLLPIYADLGRLNPDAEDLLVFLGNVLHAHGFPAARDLLKARFRQGGCILFLDGLDGSNPDAAHARLKELLAAYPKLQVVLAARAGNGLSALPSFASFECLPLSDANIADWVGRRFDKDSHAANALLQAVERNAGLRALAGNPRLLSILASVKPPVPPSPLPLPALYDECLRVLMAEGADAASSSAQPAQNSRAGEQALQELGLYAQEQHLERMTEQEVRTALKQTLEALGASAGEESLLTWITHSSLLQQDSSGFYAFLRQALRQYLAAQAIVARGSVANAVRGHAGDPYWREALVNAASLQGDAVDAIRHLLDHGDQQAGSLFLAARCAIECPDTPPEIKQRLRDALFLLLQAEDPSCWHDAALCIAALQGQRVNEFFPRALREGAVQERQRAALAMGRVGAPEWATVPLLGALDRRVPQPVRSQAAWALGQLKDKKAVQSLMAVLREDTELANEAATALSSIGEPAVPPLTSALSSDDAQVRQMAVRSLGRMGTTALRPLLQIVQDEKQMDQVVKSAADALGLLGDPQAIPPLVVLLRSRRGKLAEPAANALAGIGIPAIQSLIDALPAHSAELELRQAIVSALASIGLPSIPALTQALNSPSTAIRGAAEDALKQIGAPANQALLQALRSGDLNLRRRIAEILENTGDVGLAEPLVRMLGDKEQDSGVRVRAMHILAQVGREQAVDPLIEAMQKDPDEVVRREAVRALMDIKSERSVGPLIDMLQDSVLRDQATAALSAIGEPAVEPLILAINEGRDTGLQQAAIKALSAIGARGRVGEPTLPALARVYSQLFTEQLAPDALLALIGNMRWWKHGEELYQAFHSAQLLARSQDLTQVAQSREALAWVESIDSPFRPGIKEILNDLNSVAQDAAIYLSNPDRGGQRDAMVSTIDRLTGIQQTIDTQLLEFEKGAFTQVVEGWRRLTDEAIKNLRGRAELRIETIRDDVVLDSSSLAGTVVFGLTNTGESAARNLSVTLKRGSKDGFEVIGAATQRLDPLGTGMHKEVEFSLKPLGVEQATYALEVSYDDDEAEDRFYPISGQLRFHAIDRQYRTIPTSPYNWGPPVKTRQMFYGRQDVFAWINENISSPGQSNILILHGERRMGKTSVLYQLRASPPTPQHVCVFFSLELASTKSLGDFLLDLALAIREELVRLGIKLPEPGEADFASNGQRAFRRYYYEVVEPTLGERRLLVMVDEIDILLAKVESGVLSADTLNFLRGLMQHNDKLAFIFTGAYKVRETLKDNRSILFNIARAYKISYLGRTEAEALIVEPVAQYLNYDDLTVRTIVEVTAGHPYFIQYICDSLVKLAHKLKKNWVFKQDAQVVLQDIIQDSSGVLQSTIFAPLSMPEQMVLAALANVTDENRVYVLPEVVAQKLEQSKLNVSRKELLEALRSLRESDLVVEQKSGQSLMYGFRMGLIRMWVCQNDVLLRLSQEMRI